MQQALRISRQQRAYAEVLWQDMQNAYGDTNSPDYWRQRVKRRAYQGAIVQHLIDSAHSLASSILKQLADTRFVDTHKLDLTDVLPLLQQQSFLSAPAQLLLSAMQDGHVAQLHAAQQVFNGGVSVKGASSGTEGLGIALVASDNLDEPDQWPVAQWLRDLQELQDTTQAELLEF